MRRLALAAAALLVACTWSNSLYQARVLTRDAERAERERQPGLAQSLWGQVTLKAESAYARAPQGARGAEALWLEGHSAFRARDCRKAVPALQGALSAAFRSAWEPQLLLELGQCEETLGEPIAASIYSTLLEIATVPAVRREARLRLGHALVGQGEWQRALDALAGEDTMPARLDRAMALAHLDRTDQALAELAPALAAADSSVSWGGYLETLAVHNSVATDTLLDRVLAFPGQSPARRSTFIMRAAQAAVVFDPAAAVRRLHRLDLPGSVANPAVQPILFQQLRLTRPTTPAELRGPVDSITVGDLSDAGFAVRQLADQLRIGRLLLDRNESTPASAPRGDLTMFALGDMARDSLGATRLSSWFFARLEREWPRSPYVGKALMARVQLAPDSADVLLARLRAMTGNPYVAAANGDRAGQMLVPRLDDSLASYIAQLWASGPRAAGASDRP